MMLKNTRERYGSIAQFFHWAMALAILGMLGVGFHMTDLPLGLDKLKFYGVHKSVGVLILLAAGLRLLWRLMNRTPDLPSHMNRLEKIGAHLSHWGLYGLMFAMPLTGWVMSSAAGFPVSVFGWFTLPQLVAPDKELRLFFAGLHEWLAYGLILLLTLHATAAAIHHFYHRNTVFRHMWPGGK